MPDPLQHSTEQHHAVTATDPKEAVAQVRDAHDRLRREIAKVVVGQDQIVEELLMAMFCGGHALVVGVPGLAYNIFIGATILGMMSLHAYLARRRGAGQ